MTHPHVLQTVLDGPDPRVLAEFYRELLGWSYRAGDEPPGQDPDWLVLLGAQGQRLAFQRVEGLPRTTWPTTEVPMQLHLDMTVPDRAALEDVRRHALELGATLVMDRSDDEEEPLYVFADPAGHPFCTFVSG